MADLFNKHQATIEKAVEMLLSRGYWSAFPEMPSGRIYGETAKADGEAAFNAMLGADFALDQPADNGRTGAEISPYGLPLNVSYPRAHADTLVGAAKAAGRDWGRASVETRAGVCVEILDRLNKQSFLMANAVMHTSGQAFMMAFQAGGAHAQDRGLEAVAYAYRAMKEVPNDVMWEKPQGKQDPLRVEKAFRLVPRGVGLVIGCSTFPTWNSYPGLFASLATGNAVVVKPHPQAILPLAITVKIGRDVLAEAGFDPNVLVLAVDDAEAPMTKELVTHDDIAIIDYTGSPHFGQWVRDNAAGKEVYTEEAGVNSIVIDSTDNFKGMCQNVSFSLALYTGQMCTAPQNIYIPAGGIETNDGHKTFDEVAGGIALSMDKLLGDPDRAAAVLGAVQNPATLARVNEVAGMAPVVRASSLVEIPGAPEARAASPLILKAEAGQTELYMEERFGPISFMIATKNTAESIALASGSAKSHGAITGALYTTSEDVLNDASDAFGDAGVPLSCNLVGGLFVNQSAAFSDYHVTGANPAGNACLCDTAYVANRFRVATVRRLAAA